MKIRVLVEYIMEQTDIGQACSALYPVVQATQSNYIISGFKSGRIVKAEIVEPPVEGNP